MKKAYHITRAKNLLKILRKGINKHDRKNFPHLRGQDDPKVYVFMNDFDAVWWGKFHRKVYGKHPVILEIDINKYEVQEDYKLSTFFDSYSINSDIPPEKIKVHSVLGR